MKTRKEELKKAIKELERTMKLANEGKITLEGNRPSTALKMQLQVYQSELARAKRGEKPMYQTAWYSDLK